MPTSKKLIRNVTVPLKYSSTNIINDHNRLHLTSLQPKCNPQPPCIPSEPAYVPETGHQLTTLHLIQEIKNLQLRDVAIDCEKDFKCKAVTFHEDERLYKDLIDLDDAPSCMQSKPRPVITLLNKDVAPDMTKLRIPLKATNHVSSSKILPPPPKPDSLHSVQGRLPKVTNAKMRFYLFGKL